MTGLSPQQLQQLADRLLQQRKASARPETARAPVGVPGPLTCAQEALWLVERLGTEATAYNETVALQLEGRLDVAALQRSLAMIVERHDVLRTRIVSADDDVASQIVEPAVPLELEVIDVPGLAGAALHGELQRLADSPFDLATAPLFRATLLRIGPDAHVLLWVVHHIVWDGWSANIFVAELSMLYAALAQGQTAPALPANPLRYGEFAQRQRETLTPASLEQQRDYWRRHLAGAPALLQLPADRERPARRTFHGASHRFELPARASAALEAIGRSAGATLYMTLLALYQVLLAKLSNTPDVVVRSPTSGRTQPQIAGVIGLFVNLIAIRCDVQGEKSFAIHVERVKQRALEAFGHQDFPYEWLVADLVRKRDLSFEPIAQADFVLRDAQASAGSLPDLKVVPIDALHSGAINDLTLIAQPSPTGLKCEFVYATDLFDARTIETFAKRLVRLAQAVIDTPQRALDLIDLRLPFDADSAASPQSLTTAQQIRWQQLRAATASGYDICIGADIAGTVDPLRLAKAVDLVVAERAALRLRFSRGPGERVLQWIEPAARVPLSFIDASASDTVAAVSEFAAEGEDKLGAPALKCLLLTLGEARHLFCCRFHPLVLDEADAAQLVRRCLEVDAALATGADIQAVCDDSVLQRHLHDEAELRYGPQAVVHQDYWRRVLADSAAASLSMRTVSGDAMPAVRFDAALPAATAEALARRARAADCSVAELLYAVSVLYLHRVTGIASLRVGMRINICTDAGAPAQAFVPVALTVDPAADLDACLGAVRDERQRAVDAVHAYADVHLHEGEAAFRVAIDIESDDDVSAARLSRVERDLAVRVAMRGDADAGIAFGIAFDANPQLYEAWELRSLVDAYVSFMESVLSLAPDTPVRCAALMNDTERARVLATSRVCHDGADETVLVHRLFEQNVQRTPDAIALRADGQTLTYAQLNAISNRFAHHLIVRGVGPDSVVGLFFERSIELVVGIFGILKAGGAYLPIDPDFPDARVGLLLEDAKPMLVATSSAFAERLTGICGEHRVCVIDAQRFVDAPGTDQREIDRLDTDPVDRVHGHHLAYVMFTSGSTGRPKAVETSHAALLNRVLWMQAEYAIDADDRVLQKTPYTFDVSVWEFIWPLMTGARLVLARPGGHRDAHYLQETIRAEGITLLHFVPSMLAAYLAEPEQLDCPSLRHVICSGEALTPTLVQRFFAAQPTARLHNLYGPTEAAIDVTYFECVRGVDYASVPIGRPIWNTQMYVLDDALEPVPVGVAGGLYIGGAGLARGYRHRPDLTAERFIADPFSDVPGARLYHTGDLAKYRADGALEYLGRSDHQVKIRGVRIELGEIEALLLLHPAVEDAFVALLQHDGDKRLVGYVILRDATATIDALRAHLKRQLPEYMVPAAIVRMQAWPLTPNGKLDRRSLPAPDASVQEGRIHEPPQGDTEQRLAPIWAALLNVERVGRSDNFFDLGGHSLLGIQLLARVRAEFDVRLPFEALFECRDLQALAQRIDTIAWSQQPAARDGAGDAGDRELLVL